MSKAANAILAKTRAMYGKRLTEKDYSNLLNCKSVPEVMSYLKGHTKYGLLLTKVSETDIHRRQLELILRQQLFYDFAALCRYELTAGEHFATYIIKRTEIEQMLHFLMLLGANKPEEYLFMFPTYFESHTKINLSALTKAVNYDDFLAALTHTPYEKLLAPYKPKDGQPLNMPEIENTLYTYLYSCVFDIIDKYILGKQKEELKQLFISNIDLTNFVRILRLRKYYDYRGDKILKQLLPCGSIKESRLRDMCVAETSKEVFGIMETTHTGKLLSKLEYSYAGEISDRGRYYLSRKNIHFSSKPVVVMLSYIFLEEAEISNVINIIEGVRYQVAADRIKDILIYK